SGGQRPSFTRQCRPVRKVAAKHSSLVSALDGHYDVAAHDSRRAHWIVQKAARVQLVCRRRAASADAFAFVHRVLVAGRSAWLLGGHRGNEYGSRDADIWRRRAVWRATWIDAL